jgi:hypothetical protein
MRISQPFVKEIQCRHTFPGVDHITAKHHRRLELGLASADTGEGFRRSRRVFVVDSARKCEIARLSHICMPQKFASGFRLWL